MSEETAELAAEGTGVTAAPNFGTFEYGIPHVIPAVKDTSSQYLANVGFTTDSAARLELAQSGSPFEQLFGRPRINPPYEQQFNQDIEESYKQDGNIDAPEFMTRKPQIENSLNQGRDSFDASLNGFNDKYGPGGTHEADYSRAVQEISQANQALTRAIDALPDNKVSRALQLYQLYMSSSGEARAGALESLRNEIGSDFADKVVDHTRTRETNMPIINEADRAHRGLQDDATRYDEMMNSYLNTLRRAMTAPGVSETDAANMANEHNTLSDQVRQRMQRLQPFEDRTTARDLIFRYDLSARWRNI